MLQYSWLIPVFPLLSFTLIVFFTNRHKTLSARLAVGAIFLSFLLAMAVFFTALGIEGLAEEPYRSAFSWFPTGKTSLEIGFMVDPLTAAMLAMVTTVCLMIFIYSQGYMHGDRLYSRFFAYISLFTTGMLGLVIADNFLLAFISWEIMGLCSYLLIGFWFERPAAANAAKKAFITTKVGDVLLLLGMLLLYFQTGSLTFETIFERVNHLHPNIVLAAGLLIFAGAVGKSAQFPLHVWLPDAMEGPTPVSALIHAATMVAAGVYLVARTFPIFTAVQGHPALVPVAIIGAFTAFFASTIALAQNDIKRVLAYSTISQLGYMMTALGVGGLVAGVFHLITHAFFKALLFLGSGSVIHGVGTNDMMEMGGLRKSMPLTFWTFLAGMLALSGIPPFAGFWSKDEILSHAFDHNQVIWLVGTAAAFLTAFYMARQVFLVFFGRPRNTEIHAHESPPLMTGPLVVLALGATLLGLLGVPADMPLLGPLLGNNPFHHFIGEAFEATPFNPQVMGISISVALAGLALGWLLYGRSPLVAGQTDPLERLGPLWVTLKNKYWIDEIYNATVVRGTIFLADLLFAFDAGVIDGLVNLAGKATVAFSTLNERFDNYVVDGLVNLAGKATVAFSTLNERFDNYVVDGTVNGIGRVADVLGRELRLIQTGRVQNYLLLLLLSVLMLVGVFMYQ